MNASVPKKMENQLNQISENEFDDITVPVGSYGANNFRVHDTAGNVWERVGDCWHENYSGAPIDGSAWKCGGDCSLRVLRGGSGISTPRLLRSANSVVTMISIESGGSQ